MVNLQPDLNHPYLMKRKERRETEEYYPLDNKKKKAVLLHDKQDRDVQFD